MASAGMSPKKRARSAAGSDERARNMVLVHEGTYELGDKEGTWTYKRLSDTSGEVYEAEQRIGTFTYATISSADVFQGLFKWNADLSASKKMRCIGVTNSEIMRHVQLPESAGAYFVLPSQLNGAEYPSDDAIIREVEDYIYDNTGGPRGQLSAHPAAAQFVLANAASWAIENGINAIDGILAKVPQFKLKNGYMVMPAGSDESQAEKLFEGFTAALHTLRPLIMHDVMACGLTPDKAGLSTAKHRVGLVYASAVPVDAYCNKSRSKVDSKLHRKVAESVLVAQYYGALHAVAARQPVGAKPVQVFLLPLGGGVFNNPWESIAVSMAQAVELLAAQDPELFNRLEVEALSWSGSPAERTKLEGLLEAQGKFYDKSKSDGRFKATGATADVGSALPPPPVTTQKGLPPMALGKPPPEAPSTTSKAPPTEEAAAKAAAPPPVPLMTMKGAPPPRPA